MTEEQTKIYLSKYVIPQDHKPNEAILREIIFSSSLNINWQEVEKVIRREHPELSDKRYFEKLDLVAR